ncbi:BCCT family transporter [Cytobacillus oceanisediminis]|uniref:BCCT family transporter n=1 Tax=Cytobacillus oceanisediminis TaxID=665099 RepID=UPI001D150683|nr:BCCT family transporter [Cytobacillus oceanisediminis]MCC3648489.1 BCCT family transporter [Cytobacillus oceanisediminis]
MNNIRHVVFWPPFLFLIGASILSFTNKEGFISITTNANDWVITNLGWLFSLGGLLMVGGCIFAYFSPLGNVRIGGKQAKPMLKFSNWFAITLTTTIATLTFWSIAEPISHFSTPPESLGIEPNSPEAALFSLSTLYLHWTFTPYAIYCVPAVVFAFVYYNMKKPYSLSSALSPLFGEKVNKSTSTVIDAVCLYTLALGMAASMGTSILTLSGGVEYITGMKSSPVLWGIVAAVVTVTFLISAATGLMKGIRILSDINMKAFYLILAFVFFVGPIPFILNTSTEAFGIYLTEFFKKSLFTGAAAGDPWPQWWTTFYWASWFAWALILSLFLGRIAYGYKVKTVILVNFILPAAFGLVWMSVFGGTAISIDMADGVLSKVLAGNGSEAVIYEFFSHLPWASLIIPFFLFVFYITFVTACDSNVAAMSGISSTGITPEKPEAGLLVKVLWGIAVSLISWIMISFASIDGVKMLNNLGGVPALFLGLLVFGSLVKISLNPQKYDKTSEDEKSMENSDEIHQTISKAL